MGCYPGPASVGNTDTNLNNPGWRISCVVLLNVVFGR